jgi:topoisomerase-4 subunit B
MYNGQRVVSQNGLQDLLLEEIGEEQTLYEIAHFQGPHMEFAFTHTGTYGESYFSFVNGQFTVDGGTHQTAFRLGVLKAIDDYAGTTFSAEDVREGMIGAVAAAVIALAVCSALKPLKA